MKNLIKQYKARIEEIKTDLTTNEVVINAINENEDKNDSITKCDKRSRCLSQIECFALKLENETLEGVIRDLEKQLEFNNLDYGGFIEWLEEQKEPYELDESDGANVVICPNNEEIGDRVFSTDGGFEIH